MGNAASARASGAVGEGPPAPATAPSRPPAVDGCMRHTTRMEPTPGGPLARPAACPRSVNRNSLGAAHSAHWADALTGGHVRRTLIATFLVFGIAHAAVAQQVDMELMTYPEIAAAMQAGKTTVLIYNGGTEQRGPHAVLGGHTLIARRASVEIARRLGNALVAPVLPLSVAGAHLNPKWPGSVNLPGSLFAAVNEAVVDSMVVNGFKNVVLMGDHGGGQREAQALANAMDEKYRRQGVRVYFCGDVY